MYPDFLGVLNWLAAGNDEEWFFVENPDNKMKVFLAEVKIEYDQGERQQNRYAQKDCQAEPKPKHRCNSQMSLRNSAVRVSA
jgi:hypothetical protein